MFHTARLLIRRITPTDYGPLLRIYSDENAIQFVDDGEPISPEDTRRWVEVTLANYESKGYGMSAVELAGTGEVIGFVGLVHPGGQETPELKYAYAPDHWGQGYATEVAQAMLDWGAAEFGMTRIIATTSPKNAASHRVLLKCGMVNEGVEVDEDGDPVQTFAWAAAR